MKNIIVSLFKGLTFSRSPKGTSVKVRKYQTWAKRCVKGLVLG